MTPEEKIAAAIDRNTEAIDNFRREMGFVGTWLFFILVVLMAGVGCPRAKATPILPPLAQNTFTDIGTPPVPPPNPNLQYWHTMDVPGPDGVLPMQVFAPRLVANMASEPGEVAGVEVPEPGTAWMVTAGILALICFGSGFYQQTSEIRKLKAEIYRRDAYIGRCRYALRQIQFRIADESELREIARKALEE